MSKNIIAYSGTHGTGKTTAVFGKARALKFEYPDKEVGIVAENVCNSPYPINKQTTRESQRWIYTNQMQAELMMSAKYNLVVSDRSVVDAIAYTVLAGYSDLSRGMMSLAASHVHIYKEIYFLPLESNNYWIDNGFRESKDAQFRLKMEKVLLTLYSLLGIEDKLIYGQGTVKGGDMLCPERNQAL